MKCDERQIIGCVCVGMCVAYFVLPSFFLFLFSRFGYRSQLTLRLYVAVRSFLMLSAVLVDNSHWNLWI